MKAYNDVGPYIHKPCDGSPKAPSQYWSVVFLFQERSICLVTIML